jgi:hypothetical protein
MMLMISINDRNSYCIMTHMHFSQGEEEKP